ncbi:SDR family NAD(P)-dependent oxidoreductase [Nonomuraea endophytica]|uniref:SDR family NAD(P)-dependent oxidoreductase n=1 Tax=Nonomuraea endophytica TaxID=714136 RepID=UPI0037CB5433
MTKEQQTPMGSGFGPESTTADVLAGIDLTGRFAVVTGGYSGIGLETTRALAGAGATVAVPARRPDLARAELKDLPRVEVAAMDLTDLGSIAAYVRGLEDGGRRIDMVINSAGVMAAPLTRVGDQGWEFQVATNHLGHFALVNRLWPLLNSDARVVAVSSRGHFYSAMRWDDPFFEHSAYDKWAAYGQSKTANVLFAVHLDRLARDSGVRAFALHPGVIPSPLARYLSDADLIAAGAMDADGNLTPNFGKSPQAGAATQVWAATSAARNKATSRSTRSTRTRPHAYGSGQRT